MYYALLRWHFLPMMTAYSRWGMAYPTINEDDLRSAVVDRRKADAFLGSESNRQLVKRMRVLLDKLHSGQKELAEIAGRLS